MLEKSLPVFSSEIVPGILEGITKRTLRSSIGGVCITIWSALFWHSFKSKYKLNASLAAKSEDWNEHRTKKSNTFRIGC